MNTEKENTQQQKGKTIFIEYSTWKKGQHFITVMQTVPGEQKKVLVGRISMEQNEGKTTFIAKSADGKEVLGVSGNLVEIKKEFKDRGQELAQEELQKTERNTREESPEEKVVQTQKQNPEQEVEKIRERKVDKSKDNGITR